MNICRFRFGSELQKILFFFKEMGLCCIKSNRPVLLAFVLIGIVIVFFGFLFPSSINKSVKPKLETFYNAAANGSQASAPPRGWNSYDSFSWVISEQQFLANAQILSQKLLPFGYQYGVVDFLWYRRNESGASVTSAGYDVIDEWGRPIPHPLRWPSSVGGKGFKPVADKLHQMGLKFGIHVMAGISAQAVKENTHILGTNGLPYEENGKIWRAKDIALIEKSCAWMPECFFSVDTRVGAGRAFIHSLYRQYAGWGVDLVKHDCVFGQDLNIHEISLVSQILKDLNRPILYSISPGKHATPEMALKISKLVNMYRITADVWDSWEDISNHFDVSRDFGESGLIGSQGLLGRSWPDLGMLPFGWLTHRDANEGPHRFTKLLPQEQKVQMTLWAMTKSPLMFGGDLRHIDNATLSLITNPTLLQINAESTYNQEFYVKRHSGVFQCVQQYFLRIAARRAYDIRTWIAKGESYIAAFNLGDDEATLYINLADDIKIFESNLMMARKKQDISCSFFDVWKSQNLTVNNNVIKVNINSHSTSLWILRCS